MRRTLTLGAEPGFALPELDGEVLEGRLFEVTYFDTAERRLAAADVTLRRHVENGRSRWLLDVRGGEDQLEADGGPVPPVELTRPLATLLATGELGPVATLRTRRQGRVVRDNGHAVARLLADDVSILEPRRDGFGQVSIELVEGDRSDLTTLRETVRKAGARKDAVSVERSLGLLEEALEAGVSDDARETVRLALRRQRRALLRHDPGARLGFAEDVHQFRVAARRSRAYLRAARRLFHPTWTSAVQADLRWLGQEVGAELEAAHRRSEPAQARETGGRAARRRRGRRGRGRRGVARAPHPGQAGAIRGRADGARQPGCEAGGQAGEAAPGRSRRAPGRGRGGAAPAWARPASRHRGDRARRRPAGRAPARAAAGGAGSVPLGPAQARAGRLEALSPAEVRAAGGLVAREADGEGEGLLVHRPRYDDWSLPKGKRLPHEGAEECALREVEEETGYRCEIRWELSDTRYLDGQGRRKHVRYFAMRPLAGEFSAGKEVGEIRWASPSAVHDVLSYPRDTSVVASFGYDGRERLLLIRHASAGERKHWRGDDRLRPLDARGRRQAGRLGEGLAGHPGAGVLSSPVVCCVPTGEPR